MAGPSARRASCYARRTGAGAHALAPPTCPATAAACRDARTTVGGGPVFRPRTTTPKAPPPELSAATSRREEDVCPRARSPGRRRSGGGGFAGAPSPAERLFPPSKRPLPVSFRIPGVRFRGSRLARSTARRASGRRLVPHRPVSSRREEERVFSFVPSRRLARRRPSPSPSAASTPPPLDRRPPRARRGIPGIPKGIGIPKSRCTPRRRPRTGAV